MCLFHGENFHCFQHMFFHGGLGSDCNGMVLHVILIRFFIKQPDYSIGDHFQL